MPEASSLWLKRTKDLDLEIDFSAFDEAEEEEYYDPEEDENLVLDKPLEDLLLEFGYRIQPTECHNQLLHYMEEYKIHVEKYMKKKNRAAGRRARKALLNIFHLSRARRIEILERTKQLKPGEWR